MISKIIKIIWGFFDFLGSLDEGVIFFFFHRLRYVSLKFFHRLRYVSLKFFHRLRFVVFLILKRTCWNIFSSSDNYMTKNRSNIVVLGLPSWLLVITSQSFSYFPCGYLFSFTGFFFFFYINITIGVIVTPKIQISYDEVSAKIGTQIFKRDHWIGLMFILNIFREFMSIFFFFFDREFMSI